MSAAIALTVGGWCGTASAQQAVPVQNVSPPPLAPAPPQGTPAPPAAPAQLAPSPPGASGRPAAAPQVADEPPASSDECPDRAADGSCLVGEKYHAGAAAAFVDYAGRTAVLGLGYMQMSTRRASYDPTQRADWYAYGLNGRMFLGGRGEGVRALGAMATGRIAAARRAGLALELSAGAARGDGRTVGVGSAGVFATIYYVDIGYSFQMPLGGDRPDWLGTHMLSMRAQFPFLRWVAREWRSSDAWFPGM